MTVEDKNKIVNYLRERDSWTSSKRVRLELLADKDSSYVVNNLVSLKNKGVLRCVIKDGKKFWRCMNLDLSYKHKEVLKALCLFKEPVLRIVIEEKVGLATRELNRILSELRSEGLVERFGSASAYLWSISYSTEHLSAEEQGQICSETAYILDNYNSKGFHRKKKRSNDNESHLIRLNRTKFYEDLGMPLTGSSTSVSEEQARVEVDLINVLIDRLIDTQIELRKLKGEI